MENPKEKARELVDKFRAKFPMISTDKFILEQSIKCALICCGEVLMEIPMYQGELTKKYKFWQEVKEEIELIPIR